MNYKCTSLKNLLKKFDRFSFYIKMNWEENLRRKKLIISSVEEIYAYAEHISGHMLNMFKITGF